MMGYFNNQEATDNIIKIHEDGKKWLHTGDLGYITPDGIIYFTQRLKRMIVSNGYNIYPEVIENAIIDKNVDIPPYTKIGFDREEDEKRGFYVSEGGVTVVPKGAKL